MDITNIYEYCVRQVFVAYKKYLITVTVEVSKQLSVDTVFFMCRHLPHVQDY